MAVNTMAAGKIAAFRVEPDHPPMFAALSQKAGSVIGNGNRVIPVHMFQGGRFHIGNGLAIGGGQGIATILEKV